MLLEGETGTGKTRNARAIHQQSRRKNRPFVVVDCGAVSQTLIESELFGHEKGAFTSADRRRVGAVQEAHGGTLFLDEIGELPVELQPKLLGLLESRTFRPLGSDRLVHSDFRLITATNRDLQAAAQLGSFRADLYYRIAVIPIRIPSLGQRRHDIPQLAHELLESLGAPEWRIKKLLDSAMLARLQAARWPGNVRELRNYLERCVVFNEALPMDTERPAKSGEPGCAEAGLDYAEARRRALASFERTYLDTVMRHHDGNVSAAATSAQVDRTYLYRLLRRHGMAPCPHAAPFKML